MKFIAEKAEQLATYYIDHYEEKTVSCNIAFIQLSNASKAASLSRSRIKDIIMSEIEDPKALIFQFINGDLMIISKNIGNHSFFKICRHFDIARKSYFGIYKFPHKHDQVSKILEHYNLEYAHNVYDTDGVNTVKIETMRDKFLDLDVCDSLQDILNKVRDKRDRISVLVIDDDNFATRLVEKALAQELEVVTANTAIDGLKQYARMAPDIIFLDINMPNVSGHDFLKKIFELDPDAFVVMLSGHSDFVNINKAKHLGAKGFISKPFSRTEINEYIHQCRVAQAVSLPH